MGTSAPEPWRREGKGWTRRMYGGEVAFAAFATHKSGEGFGSLSTHATYTSRTPYSLDEFAELLRKAWIGVRFNLHPLLAAVSTAPTDILDIEGYSLYYPDALEPDVEVWAAETVIGHPSCTLSDLVASLKQIAPTARNHRASLHFAPSHTGNSFHVVLIAGHWLTDGRGALKIFNHILNDLNLPVGSSWNWGEEVVRLSIPLALATERRIAKSGEVVALPPDEVEAIISMIMEAESAAQPAFTHLSRRNEVNPSEPDIVYEIRLSPSDSKSLLQACREHGVSVTALLNVLLSMSFVKDPAALVGFKTVRMPFFPIHRGHEMLEEFRASVGLQVAVFTFGLDSDLIRSCWNGHPAINVDGIWNAARESKRQLVDAVSHDIGLIYEHEIICAILPGLLGGTGAPFYQAAVPFATSVGRMTDLFVSDSVQTAPPTWTIDKVANSFTVQWFRPVVHYWEWKGQTTIRIVARADYDRLHPVVKLKEDMMDQIRQLIDLEDL